MKVRGVLSTVILCICPLVHTFQWCRNEVHGSDRVDVCFAASAAHAAASSLQPDFYLAISAYFHRGTGWLALGSGPVMDSAMMMVFYPNANGTGTTFSMRTTSHHSPPKISYTLPQARVVSSYVGGDGRYNTLIECRGCHEWPGNALGLTARDQSWIWAFNSEQQIASDRNDERLVQHTDHGSFIADMSVDGPLGEDLVVSSDRENDGVGGGSIARNPLFKAIGVAIAVVLAFAAALYFTRAPKAKAVDAQYTELECEEEEAGSDAGLEKQRGGMGL